MKFLLILCITISFTFASYDIYYSNLRVGVIKDFSTVNENYLKIKVTNPIARLLLGKKEMIFYNSDYKLTSKNDKIKYKRDKYHIIKIIQKSIQNRLDIGNIPIQKDKYIEISKNKNYHFRYISKGKIKSNGKIFIKNSELLSLIDDKNHLKIIKH